MSEPRKLAGHAFICYGREDSRRVDQLQRELEAAGIPVWRDTASIWPGQNWRANIRHAINNDAVVFLACFSSNSVARVVSYQNEELTEAIGQLRLRRYDDQWLIPVRFDECDIPDRDIGGGLTLASIHRADLFGARAREDTARLIATIAAKLESAADQQVLTQSKQDSDYSQDNYFGPVTQNLFQGSAERLGDVCFDPSPLANDLDLAHFTGRDWLIRQVDRFIQDRPRGYVIVQGEAGVGKSALAAHLVGSRAWLHHFTRLSGGRSPEIARKSLSAQLIARWDLADEWAPDGVLPSPAGRPDWFDRLLRAAARSRDRREPAVPIVLVIDGLDEAEESEDSRMPLGLPESLPDRVFIIVTSRFGIDRRLHAIRNPAEWLMVEVDGPENLSDMRHFIDNITSADCGDPRILAALAETGTDVGQFRARLADRCGGVWIYLRYVLDEIRDGTRGPRTIEKLPGDLGGYYAEQIQRWRHGTGHETWERVRLPLLSVLAVARAPLTLAELISFAGISTATDAGAFVDEAARAFLNCGISRPAIIFTPCGTRVCAIC